MTKADLVERVTATISQTAGPMISKKDCARVVDAFLDAVGSRHPKPGLLFHSDRGSQGGFNRSKQHWLFFAFR